MIEINKRYAYLFSLMVSGFCGMIFSFYIHKPETLAVHAVRSSHYPTSFIQQLDHDPAAGKKIFYAFCTSCHGHTPLIEVNAPRIDDRRYWQAVQRLGMKVLLETTIEGKGAMPARGGCFECSDSQLQATIQYIMQYKMPKQ